MKLILASDEAYVTGLGPAATAGSLPEHIHFILEILNHDTVGLSACLHLRQRFHASG